LSESGFTGLAEKTRFFNHADAETPVRKSSFSKQAFWAKFAQNAKCLA
jgi:hypothetical protein